MKIVFIDQDSILYVLKPKLKNIKLERYRKMKIIKYNQSCLLIETKEKRILIDPGKIGYNDSLFNNEWTDIDFILVTHKHKDHCNKEAIKKIQVRDKSKLFITKETQDAYKFDDAVIIKEGDTIKLSDNIKVEVVKAIHGYVTGMREKGSEILENVGYIIDNNEYRLYTTSDTINHYNQNKCDVLCMPFNGNGLTLGIIDGIEFIKGINPQLVLPIHTETSNPIMNPNLDLLETILNQNNIENKILDFGEELNIYDYLEKNSSNSLKRKR